MEGYVFSSVLQETRAKSTHNPQIKTYKTACNMAADGAFYSYSVLLRTFE
jgi:hypothetical protein